MNLAVMLGGISPERNISFLSGRAIVSALRENGHHVVAIDPARGADCIVIDQELKQFTAAEISDAELSSFSSSKILECINSDKLSNLDGVFIALHGKYGEDGYIQALLDLRGIPYTGSDMLSSAVTMDKALSKMLFQVGGIPTPHWITVKPDHAEDLPALDEIRREMNGPFVVKPNDQGSTVGLTIVESGITDDISNAITLAAKYSSTILIERYIEGRELTVPILGDQALPIIEIEPKEGFYDYINKYTKGRTEYSCPADLNEEVRDYVMNLATIAHQVLGCKAISRVDFRLNDDNIPYCLEVNTIPGFTETSLVPMSASVAGLSFGELCEEILRLSDIEPKQ